MTGGATDTVSAYRRRVDGTDWAAVAAELADLGCALLPRLLTVSDGRELIKLYDRDDAFRSTISMRRHGFGEGEYRYLATPLPEAVDELRHALYPHLLPIARLRTESSAGHGADDEQWFRPAGYRVGQRLVWGFV